MTNFLKKDIKEVSTSVKINRKAFTFLVCLVVSILFWLLVSLSKDYTIIVTLPVKYKNMPKDKVVAEYLPETIELGVKSKGFTLLVEKLKSFTDSIQIDLKYAKKYNSKNNYYLILTPKQERITSQFGSNITITEITPDTLFFTFNKRTSKKVPVKLNQQITFKKEHQLTKNIIVTPDSIEVYGSPEMINNISYIETEQLVVQDAEKNLQMNLKLKKPGKYKFVEFSEDEVEVEMAVAKFTEANLSIPIQVQNLPSKYNLKLFPDKIEVKFKVSFEDYESIKESDFIAIVDYKTIEKRSNKLKVQLVKTPEGLKSIKISPQKVEFILRK